MGKQKIINDDVSINFRISKELKQEIIMQSENHNLTLSKYLRGILEDVHNGVFCNEMDNRNERERFIYSKEFMTLILWIYSKIKDNSRLDSDSDQKIDDYVRIIKRADRYLPNDIVLELDKVLVDLYRIKNLTSYESNRFNFISSYKENENINFKVLEDYFELN